MEHEEPNAVVLFNLLAQDEAPRALTKDRCDLLYPKTFVLADVTCIWFTFYSFIRRLVHFVGAELDLHQVAVCGQGSAVALPCRLGPL